MGRFSKWIAGIGTGRSEKVLVVSNEKYGPIEHVCGRSHWELNYASDLSAALEDLENRRVDVVVYDQDLPDRDWRLAVTSLAAKAPWSSVLLLSPLGHPELWQEVVRRGGHDILNKPVSADTVESALGLAMARAKLKSSLGKRKNDNRTAVV